MAAPTYATDLVDIDLAESVTGWTAINFSGGGGGAPAAGVDTLMQGVSNVDRPVSNAERGIIYDDGAVLTAAVATGVHIFQWLFNGTPGLSDNLATRGAYVIAGTGSSTDLVQFHVEGNDTYGAAPRVGRCYPYRYINTTSAVPPYRTLDGSPGATPRYFGAGLKTTATAKGSNLGVDAVRYGKGLFITAGEAGDAASFDGAQQKNDANVSGDYNRWGLFTLAGGSYELQGIFAIGQNTSGTATECYFEDSNRNIIILDNPHVESTFSQIILDHASTVVNWTNISITALGTNDVGRLVCNNASTTGTIDGGTYTDIGISTLRAGLSFDGTTWRGTDQITTNGATLTNCTITDSIAAVSAVVVASVAEMDDITNCSFVDNNILVVLEGGYFDASDSGPTDPDATWTSASTGFNGSLSNQTTNNINTGTETTYELSGAGTSVASMTDADIVEVRARMAYGNPAYTEYKVVTPPAGGWTSAKIQALETLIYATDVGSPATTIGNIYEGGDLAGTILATFTTAGLSQTVAGMRSMFIDAMEKQGHSIEITGTGTYDFNDIIFSGGSVDDSIGADVYNNSGGAVTININGGTTPTVRNGAGASTTIVSGTVTLTVTVQDTSGTVIQNARVLALAGATGAYPFEDVVTITSAPIVLDVAYFDGSDVAISDPDNNWSNEANVTDGNETTVTQQTAIGTETSNELEIQGTSFTGLTDEFIAVNKVVARTVFYNGSTNWSPAWQDLGAPASGDWTLAKLQALETRFWCTVLSSVDSYVYRIYEDGNVGGTNVLDLSHGINNTHDLAKLELGVEVTEVTVTHTSHGMVTGDLVVIENAVQNEYNGIQTITVVDVNSYTYITNGAPVSPATGTILATTAFISGLTDVNGKITDTRAYTVDQSLGGRVRKSTISPFYKTGDIVGTIDKDNGLSLTIVMLSDE